MEAFQFEGGYGNASSVHAMGIRAATAIEMSREMIARRVNALPEEVCFLSGGSEANNWVVRSLFQKAQSKGKSFHWATTETEHSSLSKLIPWVQSLGGKVFLIPVDAKGHLSASFLEDILKKTKVDLLSFSQANSETGTLQPIKALAEILNQFQTQIHVDACQSFLKSKIDFGELNLDYLVLSGHKIHGPKGVGALVMKKESRLEPVILGGGQESGLRSGTLNTEGIVGFGEAVSLFQNEDQIHLENLKQFFINQLAAQLPQAILQGDFLQGVGSIVNFRIPGNDGKKLMQLLSRNHVYVSTGSACDSGSKAPSATLLAMGISGEEALSSLRISFSRMNTEVEVIEFFQVLHECIKEENNAR
jgi:cysteine desulfurase